MPNLKKRLNSLPFITYIHSTMSNIFFLLYFTYLISFVTLCCTVLTDLAFYINFLTFKPVYELSD